MCKRVHPFDKDQRNPQVHSKNLHSVGLVPESFSCDLSADDTFNVQLCTEMSLSHIHLPLKLYQRENQFTPILIYTTAQVMVFNKCLLNLIILYFLNELTFKLTRTFQEKII